VDVYILFAVCILVFLTGSNLGVSNPNNRPLVTPTTTLYSWALLRKNQPSWALLRKNQPSGALLRKNQPSGSLLRKN